MRKTPEQVRAIVEELKVLYPDSLCSLQYEKDYELLFAVRLAAQCTDERVNKVTPALYARFPTLEALAQADAADARALRSALAAAAQEVLDRDGAVRRELAELEEIIRAHKIDEWNDFCKLDLCMCSGNSWTIHVTYRESRDEFIHAMGHSEAPDGFAEGKRAIEAFFERYL